MIKKEAFLQQVVFTYKHLKATPVLLNSSISLIIFVNPSKLLESFRQLHKPVFHLYIISSSLSTLLMFFDGHARPVTHLGRLLTSESSIVDSHTYR